MSSGRYYDVPVFDQTKNFRLKFDSDICTLKVKKKTLYNEFTGCLDQKYISLDHLLNIGKLESTSKFTVKLKEFNDNIHETTPYVMWHSTLHKHHLAPTLDLAGRLKLYYRFNKRVIRQYKKYGLMKADFEAYIVLFGVCMQFGKGSNTFDDLPLLAFLSLDYERFHIHRRKTVIHISNPKLQMKYLRNLRELHKMGNFFLDLMAQNINNKLSWTYPTLLGKIFNSVNIWTDIRRGKDDWIVKHSDDLNLYFSMHVSEITYNVEKYEGLQAMFKWLSSGKVQGYCRDNEGFDVIARAVWHEYKYDHKWNMRRYVDSDDYVQKHMRGLMTLRIVKNKRYKFTGSWFHNSYLKYCLKKHVLDEAYDCIDQMTHHDADELLKAMNGRLKMRVIPDSMDTSFFQQLAARPLNEMLINVLTPLDQFLLVLVADMFVWMARDELDDNIWLIQMLSSMEMWTWKLVLTNINWFLKKQHKKLGFNGQWDPCTITACKHWCMSVLHVEKRCFGAPDWHFNCSLFRQYKTCTQQGNFAPFILMNMIQCLYHYGPLQTPKNENDFWHKYTWALGQTQTNFETDYIASFEANKWTGEMMISPVYWNPDVLDSLTIATVAIPDQKSEPLYLSQCETSLELAIQYLEDCDVDEDDEKLGQLPNPTPGDKNNNKSNNNSKNNNTQTKSSHQHQQQQQEQEQEQQH